MVQAGLEVRCFAGSQAGSVYFFSRCACLISFAGVAQLVEQLICNQQVGGSSPSTSSIGALRAGGSETILYGSVPEWPKGADCKSVVSDFGGSNPPAPTIKRL